MKKIKGYTNNYTKFGKKKYEITNFPTQYQIEELEKSKKEKLISNIVKYTIYIGIAIASSYYMNKEFHNYNQKEINKFYQNKKDFQNKNNLETIINK